MRTSSPTRPRRLALGAMRRTMCPPNVRRFGKLRMTTSSGTHQPMLCAAEPRGEGISPPMGASLVLAGQIALTTRRSLARHHRDWRRGDAENRLFTLGRMSRSRPLYDRLRCPATTLNRISLTDDTSPFLLIYSIAFADHFEHHFPIHIGFNLIIFCPRLGKPINNGRKEVNGQ